MGTYQPNNLDRVSGGMLVDYTNNRLHMAARSNGNSQASLRILNTLSGQEVARLLLGDIDYSVVRLPATRQALITANDGTVSAVGLTSMTVEWSMKLSAAPTSFVRPLGHGFSANPVPAWSTPVPNPSGAFIHGANASSARAYVGSADGSVRDRVCAVQVPFS